MRALGGARAAVAAARDRGHRCPRCSRRASRLALGADDAVPARAEKEQRLKPRRVTVTEAKHGGQERATLAIAADVDEQLATLVWRQLTKLRQGVDEPQLDPDSFVEQRPQPRTVAVAQVEGPLSAVAVAVVVARPLLAGAMDGVELADERQVVGAVLAVADVPRVEPAPGQRAVDPAPTRSRAHQPGHQPRPSAGRPQRELDRQRSLLGRRRRGVDQRPQRPFPHGAIRAGRARPRRASGGLGFGALASGRDHDRSDVLAVVSHRTRALPVLEGEVPVGVGEIDGGVVERGAGHRPGQRQLARVPLDGHHPPAARVAAPAAERLRPDPFSDPRQIDLTQLIDHGAHEKRTLATTQDRNARPKPVRAAAFSVSGPGENSPTLRRLNIRFLSIQRGGAA